MVAISAALNAFTLSASFVHSVLYGVGSGFGVSVGTGSGVSVGTGSGGSLFTYSRDRMAV